MLKSAVRAAAVIMALFFSMQAIAYADPDRDNKDNDKITICHATGSSTNPYVQITISKNGQNGHDGHVNDIIPAPAGGCPASANAHPDQDNKDKDKITICHATGSASNPFVQITVDKNGQNGQNGHDGHANDIIPAPATGCPTGASRSTLSAVTVEPIITQLRGAGFTVVDSGGGVIEINGVRFIAFAANDLTTTSAALQSLPAATLVFRMGPNFLAPADGTMPPATGSVLAATFGPPRASAELAAALTAAPAPASTGSGGQLAASDRGITDALAALTLLSVIIGSVLGGRRLIRGTWH